MLRKRTYFKESVIWGMGMIILEHGTLAGDTPGWF